MVDARNKATPNSVILLLAAAVVVFNIFSFIVNPSIVI